MNIVYILLVVMVIWLMYTRLASTKNVRSLREEEFRNEMSKTPSPMLIDVREPNEFAGGYIRSAKNIPLSQLNQRLSDIPKNRELLLYCRSGMRSGKAAGILGKNGYTQLAHLQGGIGAWRGKITK
ncbi:rhodanese-like domain-containing protein [Paenibacillus sp. CMAA1364]